MTLLAILFPSPFEVDRYLYDGNADFEYFPSMFPAPREVGRYLYQSKKSNNFRKNYTVSGPSRGR